MRHEIGATEALFRLAGMACQRDLKGFLRLAWPHFQQGTPYVPTWAGDAICEHVQAWILGDIRRLGIEVPPGSGKTSRASIAGPVWSWLKDPSARWLCGSYDMTFAARLNRRRRKLLLEPKIRALTRPDYDLVRGEKAAMFFQNTAGGWMASFSPAGGITTGEHCKLMALDDLVKASNATPQVFRDIAELISGTLLSRFKDQADPQIMHVAQRLGVGDPADVLYGNGPLPTPERKDEGPLFNDFEVLSIPAGYDPKRSKVTVLGFKDPRTYEGESFFAARYPEEHLRAKKKAMGSAYFEQYDQLVSRTSGGIFQREWFKTWTHRPDLSSAIWAAFTDCTFHGGPGTDHVVIQVWAAVDGCAYLMDQIRAQMSFTETCAALSEMAQRWPQCGRWMVEASRAANGDAVVDSMRRLVPGVIGVSYQAGQTKAARAKASIEPMAMAGQLHLPSVRTHPWVHGWLDEVCGFTGKDGEQDDQVDAASGALNWLRKELLQALGDQPAGQPYTPPPPSRSSRPKGGGW